MPAFSRGCQSAANSSTRATAAPLDRYELDDAIARLSRERIESSSRNRTRTGLTLRSPGRINRPAHTLGGCDDTRGTARSRNPRCHDERLSTAWRSPPAPPWSGPAPRWPKQAAGEAGRRRRRSPTRRAISALAAPRPPISGTPTSSRSIRRSTTSPSPTRRSSASIPECCGPKARPGARRAAICCGATFPITGRCDGRRTTATSASSARRPTTLTATRSTSRADSSPASISPAGWCATSTTAPRPCSPTTFGGKKLNSPNDVVAHPDGSYWFTDPPYGGQLYEGEPDVRAAPAIPPASSIHGSASRPASCRASANCRPIAIASIPPAASTSW